MALHNDKPSNIVFDKVIETTAAFALSFPLHAKCGLCTRHLCHFTLNQFRVGGALIMGVTGLWTVVKPCARPIKLETLNRKRLAVDASIWIYQFLKAVRDKEGNALRNAHIVGFFRRICKLLYFGIKPVFVFDGGAPTLKRQTITARKKRREGRSEDAARTAGKLLAVQMQRKAEEEAERQRRHSGPNNTEPEEELPNDLVYVDELNMTPKERRKNRQFRKQDAYHLPELDISLAEMGAPNDPRIMSQEELEEYARQFHSGEDVNLYDFSKIDFNSPFFLSLPASDRYNILNAARLRSRLRMGYSKNQLDSMFPDRMAFSRFQIERVKERNDLTQRLMHLSGMTDDDSLYEIGRSARIAGERGKEYVLVKSNGVEGGWALGVLGNKDEGQRSKPIDVEEYGKQTLPDDHNTLDDEDEEFEDVPIEGLNRLPKLPVFENGIFDRSINEHSRENAEMIESVYESLKQTPRLSKPADQGADDDSLFVPEGASQVAKDLDAFFDDTGFHDDSDGGALHRAIQMSLETPEDDAFKLNTSSLSPMNKEPDKDVVDRDNASDMTDGDDMNFFAALSKSDMKKPSTNALPPMLNPFDGPLPFQPLKIGKPTESAPASKTDHDANGFEKPSLKDQRPSQPLPPWFGTKLGKNVFIKQEADDQFERAEPTIRENTLSKRNPVEIVDVDECLPHEREIIDVEDLTGDVEKSKLAALPKQSNSRSSPTVFTGPSIPLVTKSESRPADNIDAKNTVDQTVDKLGSPGSGVEEIYEWEPSDKEDNISEKGKANELSNSEATGPVPTLSPNTDFEDVEIPHTSELPEQIADIYKISNETDQQDDSAPYNDAGDDYLDFEDEELMHQLQTEAEEHARFASTLNFKSQAENAFDYEQELKQLRSQQKKDRRDADEVSHIMVSECQELLRLFGLPYITAPMEAEAQCAELVSLGLVDGVVTDDSDIFLFGGTRVYKNMFNQVKFVECYLNSDLEKEYDLDRRKLIQFAHLLGSDYTEGIPGVGPVTALEILTEFSTLEDFRDWWSQVQMGAKLPDGSHSAFWKKFKKNATKLFLPPGFPDSRVDTAYLEPEVDSDPSAFQWGVPDLNALRQFLMATVGWTQERTDEVLVPVIRDMNRREQEGTQSNITNFFQGPQGAGAFAPHQRPDRKSRMEKAFSRLRYQAKTKQQGGDITVANGEALQAAVPDSAAKGPRRKKAADERSNTLDDGDRSDGNGSEGTARKPTKKRKTERK
ncbi:ssDNA endodeoxyribonuclease RAD2 [Paracoccidioides brasiliensis Pb18]|uniref:DNA excision repair protein n=1 Tax=Paracoccidioides brasiliensis (strain Pb18) TaxID=502780 RepID=C1G2V4_PARBD|nr:ssDNA endodeoxyribonuclease RAD2 [Paracoccidioides brasiliensis Pb18]EEH45120.2 hypothetical protein PADG_01270 [Paracoccidioides brasiliensis Pb18]